MCCLRQVTVPNVAVTCTTAPGTGRGHAWQLSIAGQWSNVYLHDFGNGELGTSYTPPTVSYFEYNHAPERGVKDLATVGAESIVIYGKNFGPSIDALSSVWYQNSKLSNSTVFTVDPASCVMLVQHEALACDTVVGAGRCASATMQHTNGE